MRLFLDSAARRTASYCRYVLSFFVNLFFPLVGCAFRVAWADPSHVESAAPMLPCPALVPVLALGPSDARSRFRRHGLGIYGGTGQCLQFRLPVVKFLDLDQNPALGEVVKEGVGGSAQTSFP